MDIRLIAVTEGISVLLMGMLLASIRHEHFSDRPDARTFVVMVTTVLVMSIVDGTCYCIDGSDFRGARTLALTLNVLCYCGTSCLLIEGICYVDVKIFGSPRHLRACLAKAIWPALALIALSIASAFVPVLFSISEQNVFSRTSLGWLPFLIAVGYLLYFVVKVKRCRRRYDTYLVFPIALFITPVAIGAVVQLLFYGIPLGWVSPAIALTFLHLNMQSETNAIDQLSGLYSRAYLMSYLKELAQRPGDTGQLTGLMMDIDRFKAINDTFGHAVGDAAIASTGQILRSSLGDDVFIARYAGDEFIAIKQAGQPGDCTSMEQAVQAATDSFNRTSEAPYRLSFSIGCSTFNPSTDIVEKFLRRMDDAMYSQKAQYAKQHDRRDAEKPESAREA